MINQEFEAPGTNYQVLPNFGVSCRELRGLKVTIFVHAYAVSALSFTTQIRFVKTVFRSDQKVSSERKSMMLLPLESF